MAIKKVAAAMAGLTFALGAAQAEIYFPQLDKSYGGNVRSGPGTQFDQVGSTLDGDEITILNPTSVMMNGYEWFQICDAQGRVGFQWGGLFCSQYSSPVIFKTCPGLQAYNASRLAASSGAAFPDVSGLDAKTIEYANGFFTQAGKSDQGVGLWYEAAHNSGNGFDFFEVARDEWSVYLNDPSRDVRIQLDMWRCEILFEMGSDEMRGLYYITEANTVSLLEPKPLALRSDVRGAAFPDHSGYSVAQVIHPVGSFSLHETSRGRVWGDATIMGRFSQCILSSVRTTGPCTCMIRNQAAAHSWICCRERFMSRQRAAPDRQRSRLILRRLCKIEPRLVAVSGHQVFGTA